MKNYLLLLFVSCFCAQILSAQDYIILPTSEYGQEINNQTSYIPINMTLEEEGEEPPYSMTVGDEPVTFDDMEKEVKKYIYRNKEQLNSQLPVRLRIDKDMPYQYVAELKEELKRLSLNRVVYMVDAKDQGENNKGVPARLAIFYDTVHKHYTEKKDIDNKKQVSFKYIMEGMPEATNPPASPPFPAVTESSTKYRKIFVKVTNKEKVYIAYKSVEKKWFHTELDRKLEELKNKSSVIIRLQTEDEVTFSQYLETLGAIYKTIKEKKLNLALADYSFIEMDYINDIMDDE